MATVAMAIPGPTAVPLPKDGSSRPRAGEVQRFGVPSSRAGGDPDRSDVATLAVQRDSKYARRWRHPALLTVVRRCGFGRQRGREGKRSARREEQTRRVTTGAAAVLASLGLETLASLHPRGPKPEPKSALNALP